jgi:hypothetical protein
MNAFLPWAAVVTWIGLDVALMFTSLSDETRKLLMGLVIVVAIVAGGFWQTSRRSRLAVSDTIPPAEDRPTEPSSPGRDQRTLTGM